MPDDLSMEGERIMANGRKVTCASHRFEPGWLQRQLHDSVIRVMSNYPRSSQGMDAYPFPASWDDGERLLTVMSERFKSWTGRSIEDHIKARPKG